MEPALRFVPISERSRLKVCSPGFPVSLSPDQRISAPYPFGKGPLFIWNVDVCLEVNSETASNFPINRVCYWVGDLIAQTPQQELTLLMNWNLHRAI